MLRDHRIEISMDGRGRCHDNIFVERLWWTVKHEWIHLRPAANGIEQKRSLAEFFAWYNLRRPHQALGRRTPNEAYLDQDTTPILLIRYRSAAYPCVPVLYAKSRLAGPLCISPNGLTTDSRDEVEGIA